MNWCTKLFQWNVGFACVVTVNSLFSPVELEMPDGETWGVEEPQPSDNQHQPPGQGASSLLQLTDLNRTKTPPRKVASQEAASAFPPLLPDQPSYPPLFFLQKSHFFHLTSKFEQAGENANIAKSQV